MYLITQDSTAIIASWPHKKRPPCHDPSSVISSSLHEQVLGWEPNVDLKDGLQKTIDYFDSEISRTKHSERNIIHPDEYWLTGKSKGDETRAAGDGSADSARLGSTPKER